MIEHDSAFFQYLATTVWMLHDDLMFEADPLAQVPKDFDQSI
jgi:hypothetical protein